ncbi:MAG: hypothetical protein NTV84_01350, partial [Methanoregula sp.]|nr:hypothetical protein [Methanoregula sp.]
RRPVRDYGTEGDVPVQQQPEKITSAGINPAPHPPPAETAAPSGDSRSSTGMSDHSGTVCNCRSMMRFRANLDVDR